MRHLDDPTQRVLDGNVAHALLLRLTKHFLRTPGTIHGVDVVKRRLAQHFLPNEFYVNDQLIPPDIRTTRNRSGTRKRLLHTLTSTGSILIPKMSLRRSFPPSSDEIHVAETAFRILPSLKKAHEEMPKRPEDVSTEKLQNVFIQLHAALSQHDEYTGRHSQATAEYALFIADATGYQGCRKTLRFAALLHDIGKLGLNKSILIKPKKRTALEIKLTHKHPDEGADVISVIESRCRKLLPKNKDDWTKDQQEAMEMLATIREITSAHHELFGGKGYPCGKRGHEIHRGAQIVKFADILDAMHSDRPYRLQPVPSDIVVAELKSTIAGEQVDPEMVKKLFPCSVGGDQTSLAIEESTWLRIQSVMYHFHRLELQKIPMLLARSVY